ncbi:MAG: TlpA family protein disulfide reductase, partial [Pirellulaceae bacterium]
FEVIGEGYFSSPVVSECVWSGDIADVLPEKVLREIPTLRGQVVDSEGQSVIGSIVRLKHRGRGDADPMGTSSADGSFELKLSRIPYAWNSGDLETTVYALAFDPNSNRAGIAEIDLTDAKATSGIKVEISAKPADWPLTAIGRAPEAQKLIDLWDKQAEKTQEYTAGQVGKIPPDMKGSTWLNTNAESLEDFRGQYVLLDFWFIGCGPCMRDMPSVKIAQQQYSKHGFSVVSVNVLGQKVEDVESFARQHGMNYPIVVDDAKGSILEAYRPLGVAGFPSYILLGPDGRIVQNDQLPSQSSLRNSKLEIIHQYIRESINQNQGN